ncbi:cilia- and flagella-associated protein HOATZ isoform 2-T4 [Anomaloglossus baeobatrachus]|uniref:cilia- and flagella-associated protein HOATZ isoform X2 n=1 Tax=Anomaloglossus baeobatrachus TaxID=238106 RepID=UPI003F4FCF8F
MAGTEYSDFGDYTVFTGSTDHDVMCSKIFWNSVTLQPPLESSLVSGDVEQRRREGGQRKNYLRQELEDLRTEYFLLEAQRVQAMEQRSIYLEKAKRREEIIALLKKQREERMKVSHSGYGRVGR